MKIYTFSFITFLLLVFGCSGGGSKKEAGSEADTVSVSDTGYTGIKQYTSGPNLIKEVTFKNGVREGLMKSFYFGGKVRQTFWYENDLREDSAKWFYETGELFRSTPYLHDTITGIQKQYYRNGRLKTKIEFKKGFRTLFFEEYSPDGKLIGGYPEVVVTTKDDYRTSGTYRITLALSDKSDKVRFYRGDPSADGVFDTTSIQKINLVKGIGNIILKKTPAAAQSGHVGVFAEILTSFGNNKLVYKKIDLPYKDLK